MRAKVARRIRKQVHQDCKVSKPEMGERNAYRHAKRDYNLVKSDPARVG